MLEKSSRPPIMENFWSFYCKSKDSDPTKKDLDLRSCFLVEASGDSEVDSDPNIASEDLADDDAQSCSCDVSDYYSCVSDPNGYEVEDKVSVHAVPDDDNNREEKEQKVLGYQTWGDEHLGLSSVNQKSCVSVESTNEPMNEMEKSRLFWETCLAS